MLALRRSLFGLPMGGGHKRLKAHPTDDLFESRVVAACRNEKGTHGDLWRVFQIFTGQSAQPQSCATCRLKK